MNSPVPSAAARPTVSSASPQMNRVGTLVGPTGCRVPRARYQASAASIMADEVKAPLAMAGRGDDVERIADQPVDAVIVEVRGIGAGIDRIAALVRRHRQIARLRQSRQLVVPKIA